MSTFICEKCGCIDNTAMDNNYWISRTGRDNPFKDEYANTHALCTVCTPEEFKDGSKTSGGKWHNSFTKDHWTKYGKEKILAAEAMKQGDMVNATKYFKDNGLL